ncbi:hypothetical protein TWF730_006123 [Orbilia blumenaviensis]|uniref:Peptidase A1 domain-containing protein n=1 Tax=Orbilia blumenaviensis TaxID=1796055 RepID=A0AAV9TWQ3_9PEZI
MRSSISALVYLLVPVYASISNKSSVCSDPPNPIQVHFGDVVLGSFHDARPEPTGYGLQVVLGGEFFAPRIELVGSPGVDMRVSRVARNCTELTPVPLDCKLGSSYHTSTAVLAGGVYSELYSGGKLNYPVNANNRDVLGTETLELASTLLNNFTFQYNRDQMSDASIGLGSLVSSYLNLGPDSGLLRRLVTDGSIASRSWSFFAGLLGTGTELHMIDIGGLILGGYHPTQVKGGKFKEFPLPKLRDDSCLFPVNISGVRWIGQEAIDSNSSNKRPFTACINPGSNRLEFPFQVWETLERFSLDAGIQSAKNVSQNVKPVNPILPVDQEGLVIDDYQWKIENASPNVLSSENLTMTIQVENGPEITIPHTQIFQRRRRMSNKGFIEADRGLAAGSDSERRTAILTYPDQSAGTKPIFGLPFLSAAYFTVNYETGIFGLAPIDTVMNGDWILEPFLPAICSVAPEEKTTSRLIEAKIVAPVAVGSAIVVVCAVIAIYRRQQKYRFSLSAPFIRGVKPEKRTPEMDATGPFEHEVDGKPIYELPNNRSNRELV